MIVPASATVLVLVLVLAVTPTLVPLVLLVFATTLVLVPVPELLLDLESLFVPVPKLALITTTVLAVGCALGVESALKLVPTLTLELIVLLMSEDEVSLVENATVAGGTKDEAGASDGKDVVTEGSIACCVVEELNIEDERCP